MTYELGQRLKNDFPQLYSEIVGGFSCGDGWEPIIRKLSERIVSLNLSHSVEVVQVKEKFGGLRYYFDIIYDIENDEDYPIGEADIVDKLVKEAEAEADQTCEKCGKPGTLNKSGYWLNTRCEEHSK